MKYRLPEISDTISKVLPHPLISGNFHRSEKEGTSRLNLFMVIQIAHMIVVTNEGLHMRTDRNFAKDKKMIKLAKGKKE